MKQFLGRFFRPEKLVKRSISTALIVAIALSVSIFVQQWIVKSRIVTQDRIAEGWRAAGLELTEHTIQHKENFWKVAKEYGVDIDTIVGANPGLGKLSAAQGQTIRVVNKRGVIHRTSEQESTAAIATLYNVSPDKIVTTNNLTEKSILVAGLELFVPGAKPKKLSDELTAQYSLRGIFASPLPGRITSSMGMRKHPVGGFRGKHTGIDLGAKDGTSIAAAASGTVVSAGEGDYIGKFVVIAHENSYTTIYGHCSQLLTSAGKTVKKGQIIAKSGHTGRVTGPHLHFEIRKNNAPQDPLKYLW
jgi:murein DD-endopeptidase MepM/ murein hydrolase activator NlpD